MSEEDKKTNIPQEDETSQDLTPSDHQENSIFNVERIYVKNISLESPRVPHIFLENIQPEIDIKFNVISEQIHEGLFDGTLTAVITARSKEGVIFLCEASQSGVFRLEHLDEKTIDYLLNVSCPTILFPYLRELLSSIITRAGFPPIYLNPINFEAMYEQQLVQKQVLN